MKVTYKTLLDMVDEGRNPNRITFQGKEYVWHPFQSAYYTDDKEQEALTKNLHVSQRMQIIDMNIDFDIREKHITYLDLLELVAIEQNPKAVRYCDMLYLWNEFDYVCDKQYLSEDVAADESMYSVCNNKIIQVVNG